MIAQPDPYAPGGPAPGGPAPGAMTGEPPGTMMDESPGMPMAPGRSASPGGDNPVSPVWKTVVAGVPPPTSGGQRMPPGQMPAGSRPASPGGAPASAPNKTVILAPDEGARSVARTGDPQQSDSPPQGGYSGVVYPPQGGGYPPQGGYPLPPTGSGMGNPEQPPYTASPAHLPRPPDRWAAARRVSWLAMAVLALVILGVLLRWLL
jgi:hypothetical protein